MSIYIVHRRKQQQLISAVKLHITPWSCLL